MRIDSAFTQIGSLNEIGLSGGIQSADKLPSRLSSYFEDGIDFPAATKGDGGKITLPDREKISVECEGGGRPNVRPISGGGYELSCPGTKEPSGKGGKGDDKKEPPPPQKDSPSGTPIVP
jgi:hypothetical protein